MTFNADGSALIYDAVCRIKFGSKAAVERWSLYSLELNTGKISMVVAPIDGLDTADPSASHTSTRYLTFDVYNPGNDTSTVLVLDLVAGKAASWPWSKVDWPTPVSLAMTVQWFMQPRIGMLN